MLAEAGILERERPFHAYWVRQFFNRRPGRARLSLDLREMQRFLAVPRDSPAMEPWQVEQARTALRWWCGDKQSIRAGSAQRGAPRQDADGNGPHALQPQDLDVRFDCFKILISRNELSLFYLG